MLPFQNCSAVVTGGSRGIGFAIARELARGGCKVCIAGRDTSALEKAVNELTGEGLSAWGKRCDVAVPAEVEALFREVGERSSSLDFLVNNAGVVHSMKSVAEIAVDDFRRVLDVNLLGTFLCCRSALPLMQRGAAIVNVLSGVAYQPFVGMSGYAAAKAGTLGFTNTMREELRPKGIRVLALAPGAVDTDIWQQFWPEAPRQKMMSPEDVGRAVALALSMPPGTGVDEIRMNPTVGRL